MYFDIFMCLGSGSTVGLGLRISGFLGIWRWGFVASVWGVMLV